MTPADAIINAAKDLTAALRGDVPGPLGATSLDDLKKLEEIFSQEAKSHKNKSQVVAQPPRVREEAATPPRVATPTVPPPKNIINKRPRVSEWPPEEDLQLIDDFPERYGIIAEVPELRPILSHPNEDDHDNEDKQARPQIITQEDTADAPARNTRSQHRTLMQEVIYSCMDITSTPATPR